MSNTEESDFGKGFAYCIGLFLCHDERRGKYKELETSMERASPPPEGMYPSLWFNAAADHLFDMVVPECLHHSTKLEIETWRSRCLQWRLDDCSWDDVDAAIQFAKDTLRMWDEFHKIDTIKGTWE